MSDDTVLPSGYQQLSANAKLTKSMAAGRERRRPFTNDIVVRKILVVLEVLR